MADQIFHEGSHSSREIIRQRVFSDSLDMDQYGCRRLRITRSGRAISICESNLDASALEPPCQNGNTREQPRRRQFHVRIIVHMKPCRAIHGVARRLRQRLFSRPEQPDWSSHRVPITREFAGTPLLRLRSGFNYLPLQYSASGAVPSQSRRHAVRSSLDPLAP